MSNQRTKYHLRSISTSTVLTLILNTIEFLAGVVVIGVSGANLGAKSDGHSASIYAIIVSLLSLVTVPLLSYFTLSPPPNRLWIVLIVLWQWILAVLWAATAGTLGSEAGPDGDGQLRAGMVVALVGMIAWLVGAVMGAMGCCCAGKGSRKMASVDW